MARNFHDSYVEAHRLLREVHPLPYSLDQKCQQMSGYYMQWVIQGNESGIDESGSAVEAAAKNSPLTMGSINDPAIPVGALLYWGNNHVMRKLGVADGRTVASNTSKHGDRIESIETFWGISHADTYPGPYVGWSARDGHSAQAAPYAGIDPWPNVPVPAPVLAGNQRQVKTSGYVRVRAEASTISAELGNAAAGSIVTLAGWKHGETVDGNDIWFTADTTAPYRWSWSGGFTDTGTHDLTEVQVSSPELEPAAPNSSAPEPPAPDVPNSGPDLSTSPEPANPLPTSPEEPPMTDTTTPTVPDTTPPVVQPSPIEATTTTAPTIDPIADLAAKVQDVTDKVNALSQNPIVVAGVQKITGKFIRSMKVRGVFYEVGKWAGVIGATLSAAAIMFTGNTQLVIGVAGGVATALYTALAKANLA